MARRASGLSVWIGRLTCGGSRGLRSPSAGVNGGKQTGGWWMGEEEVRDAVLRSGECWERGGWKVEKRKKKRVICTERERERDR